MDTLLWILAILLVGGGFLALFRTEIILGVVLIVLGLLVGPGGVSLLSRGALPMCFPRLGRRLPLNVVELLMEPPKGSVPSWSIWQST